MYSTYFLCLTIAGKIVNIKLYKIVTGNNKNNIVYNSLHVTNFGFKNKSVNVRIVENCCIVLKTINAKIAVEHILSQCDSIKSIF